MPETPTKTATIRSQAIIINSVPRRIQSKFLLCQREKSYFSKNGAIASPVGDYFLNVLGKLQMFHALDSLWTHQ